MTSPTPSRNPLTLAEVIAAAKAAPDLTDRRRQDIVSAVRTVARLLQSDPARIPASPRLLSGRLSEIPPAAHGMSQARWNNVRSLLRAGLALCGPITPGRHLGGLSDEWRVLRDALQERKQRVGLSRFMHHCSAAGLSPLAVDDEVMEAFGAALLDSLIRSPAEQMRGTRFAWNRACAEQPCWPGRPVGIVSRRISHVLRWSALPASLRADAQGWLDRLAGHDLLDDLPFRPVKPATLEARDRQIRAFASALVHRGRDPALLQRLADLVELPTLKDGLRYFLDRNGGKSSGAIADLAATLKAIARHWVKVPQAQLDQISAMQRKLDVRTRSMTLTNRHRLRQFDDADNVRALLNLPQRLIAQAERIRAKQPRHAALRVQMAVAIDVLLMAPVRISNLVEIDIDRNLIRLNRQGSGLHLVIPSGLVKNRQELEFPLPESTVRLIERYLAEFRPTLASNENRALFPCQGLSCKGRGIIGQQIKRVVHLNTGLRLHPHLFRHIGAKLFLDANPGAHEVVRRVLGHRSIETTMSYYTGMETAAAVRHFDATILKLRGERAAP